MEKSQPMYRRAFGRQVAVELREDDLGPVQGTHGGDGGVVAQGTRSCDGTRTGFGSEKDCTGGAGWDDDAGEEEVLLP